MTFSRNEYRDLSSNTPLDNLTLIVDFTVENVVSPSLDLTQHRDGLELPNVCCGRWRHPSCYSNTVFLHILWICFPIGWKHQFDETVWRIYASFNWTDIDSGNGLVPVRATPLTKPILTYNLLKPRNKFSDILDEFFGITIVVLVFTGAWISLIARFMGPTWGPSGTDRTQVGPCWPHGLCYLV